MALRHFANNKNGFVTLVSVLIMGAIAVSIIVSSLSINTDNIIATKAIEDSKRAKYLAESCGEHALNTLKTTPSYSGNETLNLTIGSCQVGAISGIGNTNRSFTTSSNYNGHTSKISITVDTLNPTTNLSQWREIN